MGPAPTPRLLVRPHGPAARAALWRCVTAGRAGDPLAPVSIAVPSAYAGLSLRREAGRRPGGLVNLRFLSLDAVAGLLGPRVAPGRVPLTATRRAGAIRAALDRVGGPFRELAGHPATTRAFATTLTVLDHLDDEDLARVASAGPRAAAVVAVAREVRSLLAGTIGEEDRLRAAAAAVEVGTAALDDVGRVVWFAPRAPTPGALALVTALAHRGRAAAVLACTGDPRPDAAVRDLAAHLAPLLGGVDDDPATAVPHPQRILSCADADDEARVVVREVARRLEAGEPLHRMAVAYRSAVPYARLLHEHFAAAGIPVHGPHPATLRETVAGRTLLALLRVRDRDFRRTDVAALLTTAPLRERPGGPVVPGPRWDRISRQANVVGGLAQWESRLDRFRRDRERDLARRAAEAGTLFAPEVVDRAADHAVDHAARLSRFVRDLAVATIPPASTWAALSAWALGLLDRYVGPRPSAESAGARTSVAPAAAGAWPEAEVAAHARVVERVRALAELDELGAPASVPAFVRAVDDELAAPVGHGGTFGDGVLVAPVGDLRGTDHDTVLVVGAVEGSFPPPPPVDPLLPAGPTLAGAGPAVVTPPGRCAAADTERDDYLAALAAGGERVLTTARADRRAGRAARPAPWLLEAASHLAGRPVLASELDPHHATARTAGWLEVVASFEAGLADAPTAGSLQEHHLRSLLRWKHAGHSLVRHPLALAEPALRTGYTALAARRRRSLGPWEGVIGERAGLALGTDRPLSATSLEQWARCPFRYFLARVLRVEELERPEARERLAATDRGTIIHDVLQEFVETHPRATPDQRWTPEERAALRAIAEARCDAAEADGITGRAVWWDLDRARILREIDRVLDTDEWARTHTGTVPYALELGFGTPGDPLPPLTMALPGVAPVAFRGRIDRVDRSLDGTRVVVHDYKTGTANELHELARDPVMRGRRLQLGLYATVLQRAFPQAEVAADYWFTREEGPGAFTGFTLDDAVAARLDTSLTTIVGAVAAGRFPAYPGADGWWGPERCRWCEYDRVCPGDRVRRLERRRTDPALAPILTLAEGPTPSDDADGGGPS